MKNYRAGDPTEARRIAAATVAELSEGQSPEWRQWQTSRIFTVLLQSYEDVRKTLTGMM